MELGISTASFYTKLATEETFGEITKIGADVCEIFLSSFCEYEGHILDDIVANKNLPVNSIHALTNQFEPDLFNRNERASNDAFEILERVLVAGERLNAKFYTFHGATRVKKIKYNFNFPRLAEVGARIIESCKLHNLQLSYETVHWAYFTEVEYFKNIKKLCPDLKCTLDIKQIMQSDEDYRTFVDQLGSDISTMHLCDYREDRSLCLPGSGSFDFKELFARLHGVGFDGACIMEVYPESYNNYDELGKSFDYLRECIANIR